MASTARYTRMLRLPACVLGLIRATRALTGSGHCLRSSAPRSARRAPAAASLALTAASSSTRLRSTISMMRASTGTRSPGWASRCDTRPLIGATSTVSASVLRATSAAASAAWKLACAPLSVEGGSVQCRLGDEALFHQRLVVVELALRDVDLGFGRIGLVLRLAQPGLVFGGLDACDHLARLDGCRPRARSVPAIHRAPVP
jgi:hypothetical protein